MVSLQPAAEEASHLLRRRLTWLQGKATIWKPDVPYLSSSIAKSCRHNQVGVSIPRKEGGAGVQMLSSHKYALHAREGGWLPCQGQRPRQAALQLHACNSTQHCNALRALKCPSL